MNKTQKSELGFSHVELALVVVVVVLLGLMGWFVYSSVHQKPATTPDSSQESAVATQESKISTTGWKQYCSKQENACIKYPPDWKLTLDDYSHGLPPPPGSDSAVLESPDQNDSVWLLSDFGGYVNTCHLGQSYPRLAYEDVTAAPGVSNLYFVKVIDHNASPILSMHIRNGHNGKPPTVSNTGTICPTLPVFKSKSSERYVQLFADVSPQASSDRMALIKKILLSISY